MLHVDFGDGGDICGNGFRTKLKVRWFSWAATGGPDEALLDGTICGSRIGAFLRLPGKAVSICDELGNDVWWGMVLWVAYGSVRVSLENMVNRVQARFQGGVTAWAEDSMSIRRFGVKERVILLRTTSRDAAESARDAYLHAHASLQGQPRAGGNAVFSSQPPPEQALPVQVGCIGWWRTLGWKYFRNPARAAVRLGASPDGWRTFGRSSSEYRVAQAFTIAAGETWTLRQIRCTMRTSGKPADRVFGRICRDEGGVPGEVLAAGSVDSDALSGSGTSMVIDLAKPLVAGEGTYWVVWSRSGALLPGDAFALRYLSTAGSFLLYQYGSWFTFTGTVTLDVLGGQHLSTAALFLRTARAAGQFLEDVALVGIHPPNLCLPAMPLADECEDGSRTGLDVLGELFSYGTLDGRRVLSQVTPRRVLRIFPAPAKPEGGTCLRMGGDGRLYAGGRKLPGCELSKAVGRWVLPIDLTGAGSDAVFIDGGRYDAAQDKATVYSHSRRDEIDAWLDRLRMQGNN